MMDGHSKEGDCVVNKASLCFLPPLQERMMAPLVGNSILGATLAMGYW